MRNPPDQSGRKSEGSSFRWPSSWQKLKQDVLHLAQFGSSIQVIEGKSNGGKTVFFNHLLTAHDGALLVGVNVEEGAGLAEFFQLVLDQLGLRPDPGATPGELMVALRGFIQNLHRQRSRAVLLVDNADVLTDPELGALISLIQGHTDAGVGLHMVLFARPGFVARLDRLNVLDVEIHDQQLPEIVQEPQNIALFDDEEPQQGLSVPLASKVWDLSDIVPDREELVNQTAPVSPAFKGGIWWLKNLPFLHVSVLCALLAVLIWAFWSPEVEMPSDQNVDNITSALKPTLQEGASISSMSVASDSQAATGQTVIIVNTSTHSSIVHEPAEEKSVTSSAVADLTEKAVNMDETLEEVGTRTSTEIIDRPPVPESPQTPDKPEAKISAAQSIEILPSVVTSQKTPVGTPQSGTLSELTSKEAPQKTVSPQNSDNRALMQEPSSNFVLQLLGSSSLSKLQEFVGRQPNRAQLRIYSTLRDGKPFHVVVAGSYADKNSAGAAIKKLPPEQLKLGPWPKKIDLIHKEIRAFRI